MRQIIFLKICFLGVFNMIAQDSVLEGKLIVANPADLEIAKNELQIYLVSCEPDRIAEVKDNLTFKFENLNPGEYELLFFPNGDTDYSNRKIHIDSKKNNVKHEINYFFNCKYDVSKHDKTCPKCKKQNRVIPVENSFLSYDKKSFSLGCIKSDCEPNWYCKKDKILF